MAPRDFIEYHNARQPQHAGGCVYCKRPLVPHIGTPSYAIVYCQHDAHYDCAIQHWAGKAVDTEELCQGQHCNKQIVGPPVQARFVEISSAGAPVFCTICRNTTEQETNVCFEVSATPNLCSTRRTLTHST